MYYLKGDVVTGGRVFSNCFVEIMDGEITYVGNEQRANNYPLYEMKNGIICPGFTDIHMHGISGFDFMDNAEAFYEIADRLPHHGVTSFLATSRTATIPEVKQFLEAAKAYKDSSSVGAHMLGVHIEGPWISSKFSGAQNKTYIHPLTWDVIEDVINPYLDIVSTITLAPEELEDYSIIDYLNSHGVHVSAGHTNATIDEIGKANKHGLKRLTHTFNAMSPIHHRSPGTAAAALYYDDLICEIITDGVHIHPKMIELLYKIKGSERLVLISDCTGYNELADGAYFFRDKNLIKKGNKVTLENYQLAGSALTLDKGIKYVVEQCRIPIEKAIYMATQVPVNVIGKGEKRGRIETGYRADLVMLDSDLNVKKTIMNGDVVYST